MSSKRIIQDVNGSTLRPHRHSKDDQSGNVQWRSDVSHVCQHLIGEKEERWAVKRAGRRERRPILACMTALALTISDPCFIHHLDSPSLRRGNINVGLSSCPLNCLSNCRSIFNQSFFSPPLTPSLWLFSSRPLLSSSRRLSRWISGAGANLDLARMRLP